MSAIEIGGEKIRIRPLEPRVGKTIARVAELRAAANEAALPDWAPPKIIRIGGARPGPALAKRSRMLGRQLAPPIEIDKSTPWWILEAEHHAELSDRAGTVWDCRCAACGRARREARQRGIAA